MIQLYRQDNQNYSRNADYNLQSITCELVQNLNGSWVVTLEYPADGSEAFFEIKKESVIAVPTPNSEKQLFRIFKTEKTEDSVIASAYPIFLDAANDLFILDKRPTQTTGQGALDSLLDGSRFEGSSDITDISTAYYIRKNVMECIAGDDDQSFLHRWGGEISYDNYRIIINKTIGSNDGVEVRFGKNMLGVTETIDTSEMATRLVPLAYDGYMLPSAEPWVDSPLIENYAKKYIKVLDLPEYRLKENPEDEEGFDTEEELINAMIEACKREFENGADLPQITYEVEILDLSQTIEYEAVRELEKVHLGDVARCVNENLGITTTQKVVGIKFDCISKSVVEVTLGQLEETAIDTMAAVVNRTAQAVNDDGTLKGEKVSGIINMMQAKLRASTQNAENVGSRSVLFEDTREGSPTYGAMAIGTTGFEIASQKTPSGEWDWRTFGTGEGFVADCIISGVMYSQNYIENKQGLKIDLNRGLIETGGDNVGLKIERYGEEISSLNEIYRVEEEGYVPTLSNYPANQWYNKVTLPHTLPICWTFDAISYGKHLGAIMFVADDETPYKFVYDKEKGYRWEYLSKGSEYLTHAVASLDLTLSLDDETNKLVSLINAQADKINLTGADIHITAGSEFTLDSPNTKIDKNGVIQTSALILNADNSEEIKTGFINLRTTQGTHLYEYLAQPVGQYFKYVGSDPGTGYTSQTTINSGSFGNTATMTGSEYSDSGCVYRNGITLNSVYSEVTKPTGITFRTKLDNEWITMSATRSGSTKTCKLGTADGSVRMFTDGPNDYEFRFQTDGDIVLYHKTGKDAQDEDIWESVAKVKWEPT